MIKQLLEHLGLKPKKEGSQLVVNCPACDDKTGHLYITTDTGLGYCHKCGYKANPYQLTQKITGAEPAAIFKILEQFNLSDKNINTPPQQRTNKPILTENEIRKLTDEESSAFCTLKQIDVKAFLKFQPYILKDKPHIVLPAFCPGNPKAVGWMRLHLEGKPIEANGKEQKSPMVSGSKHGLLGLKYLNSKEIIFAEGWRDALSAIEAGYAATASTGGASCFKDEWLPAFKDKIVYIVMDRDKAGVNAASRAVEAISTVSKEVRIVELPYDVTDAHGHDLWDYLND